MEIKERLLHTFKNISSDTIKVYKPQHGKLPVFSIYCKSIWQLYFPEDLRWILTQFFSSASHFFPPISSPFALPLHFIAPYSCDVGEKPVCCHWSIDQSF